MKQLMKIVGAELVHQTTTEDGLMELTLLPYNTISRKKPSFMDLAADGIDAIMSEAIASREWKTKMYMNLNDWLREFKNQPLSNVWVEISLDKVAQEIAKEGV